MSTDTTFGDYIRELRTKADLGLREAARQLGISPSYLSRLEAGEFKPPTGERLLKMAHVYKGDIKKLLDLAKNREGQVMTADTGAAPAVQAFYRAAHDQSPENQMKMLEAALQVVAMSEDQKKLILEQFQEMMARSHGKDLPRRAKGDDGLFAFDVTPRRLTRIQIRDKAQEVLRSVFPQALPLPIPIEKIVRLYDSNIVLMIRDDIEGGRLRDGSPAVLGKSRWSPDGIRRELIIHEELYDTNEVSTRRRANFTMAHEFFHCIEHLPLVHGRSRHVEYARPSELSLGGPGSNEKFGDTQNSKPKKLWTKEEWREWQANTFAAELLMPAVNVQAAFEKLFGVPCLTTAPGDVSRFADEVVRYAPTGSEHNGTTSLINQFDVNPLAMSIRLIRLGLISSE